MLVLRCFQSIVLARALFGFALAEKLPVERHQPTDCFYTCTYLGDLTWGDIPANTTYFAKFGTSKLFIDSFEYCLETFCSNQAGADQGWTSYQNTAALSGIDMPSRSQVQENLPPDPSVADIWTNRLTIYNETIVPSVFAYQKYFRTLDTMSRELYYGQSFGYALYILLLVIVGIGLISRAAAMATYRRTGMDNSRSEASPSHSKFARLWTLYQKHIGTPALLGQSHAAPAYNYFSVPTRLQGLFILCYVALNVIYSAVGYVTFDDNTYYPDDRSDQIWRYLSDRTGILSFWNLPLLWLFAGRNNILLWITGWSYHTTNLMHRWAARVTTLEAIVHSVGYTVLYRKTLATYWAELWWRTGVFATVTMSLGIVFAMLPIRRFWYEAFLIIHISLAAVTLPLLWYHVDVEMAGQYNPFLITSIAIWAFDRFIRLVRTLMLSYNVLRGDNAVIQTTSVDPAVVRLTMDTPLKLSPKPGQYYYIYDPISITPWQNHPFTLASWTELETGTRLNFIIGIRSGATKSLRRTVGNGPTSLKIMVEGPYGHPQSLELYDHVFFMVGGSGITAILPYIHRLKARSPMPSITLVWSIKNNAYASSVLANELATFPGEIVLHITEHLAEEIAITTGTEKDLDDALQNIVDKEIGSHPPSISTIQGRPSMQQVTATAIDRLTGNETLAIMICGPATMADDLRRTVSDAYGTKNGKISATNLHYCEERFGW